MADGYKAAGLKTINMKKPSQWPITRWRDDLAEYYSTMKGTRPAVERNQWKMIEEHSLGSAHTRAAAADI